MKPIETQEEVRTSLAARGLVSVTLSDGREQIKRGPRVLITATHAHVLAWLDRIDELEAHEPWRGLICHGCHMPVVSINTRKTIGRGDTAWILCTSRECEQDERSRSSDAAYEGGCV